MVKQKAESGMTVKEWCEANQITEHAYYYRLGKVRKAVIQDMKATSEIESPSFVQVQAASNNFHEIHPHEGYVCSSKS